MQSVLRWQGTPLRAHLQLPELRLRGGGSGPTTWLVDSSEVYIYIYIYIYMYRERERERYTHIHIMNNNNNNDDKQ